MDTTKIVVAVVILLLLGGGAYFYFQNQNMNTGMPNNSMMQSMVPQASDMPSMSASDHGMMASDSGSATSQIKEFVVEGSNFKFLPATITVNKGDTVKVTFKNIGGFHDFVVDEFAGAKTKQIGANTEETIQFVADKAGTFEYYCSVGNHRGMGMVGKLIVK